MKSLIRYTVFVALIGILAARSGRAQDILAPPPDLDLDFRGTLPRSLLNPSIGIGQDSSAITRGQAEEIDAGEAPVSVPGEHLLFTEPAEVWSSHTWVERGYWYAVEEAVFLNRLWDRRNTLIALEPVFNPAPPFGDGNLASSNTTLQIKTGHPGAVANARLTLGRFLFRDTANRDHLFETTYFGFGKEIQRDSIVSGNPNSLRTPDGSRVFASAPLVGTRVDVLNNLTKGNPAFEFSNSQAFAYTHEFESLEFNYRVKQRPTRDWMVMRPDGNWVREAPTNLVYDYSAGIRWFSHDEWLDWTAEGLRNGAMRIKTNNDLLGIQLGAGAQYSLARWSFSLRGLAGPYVNFARLNRDTILFNDGVVDPIVNDAVRAEEEDLSFVGEFQAVGRYHIHPNFSVRFGYQLMYVDSVAIAPYQITFEPQMEIVGLSGSSLYQGWLLGIDGYW